jgi:hypothetical protein
MSIYHPDYWRIVELKGSDVPDTYHRILAGWSSSYLHGASWKLSSGITKIVQEENHYDIHNHSGSIYRCVKGREQLSSYTQNILESYRKDNSEKIAMEIVSLESILKLYS